MEMEMFNEVVKYEVMKAAELILDKMQIVVPNPDQWKVLRGQILRHMNDCVRNLQKELECESGSEST